jgi:predicted DNA-binding transcriptional regulator YafY
MNPLVCQAIRDRRVVRFHYGGGTRDVEPYCHGFSKDGHELLSGYQAAGFSRSGERFGWKTFRLDAIRALLVTDQAFSPARPGYDPHDSRISDVHCRI